MKLFWSMVVYLLFAFFMGWGILVWTVRSNPWLLIVSAVVYLGMMTKMALLQKEEH